ncbi:MAG TPA: diguanylate cyclase [Anaeromyxobacter sp.]|nr:diguanylate cyclase [Anaeromyxobacter sp.]
MGADDTRVRAEPPAERRGGGACLLFVAGGSVLGLQVPLEEEVTLGRDPGCAVPLPSDDVSRRHARIVAEGEGHRVQDLGSTNGTFVNGVRVEGARLAPGDRVRIGPFVARYLVAGDAVTHDLASVAELARRDPLTGLANRRALAEALSRELARARRAGTALAVAVLDVDRFKQVNDAHGHPAGDAVLAAVAARASAALREGDLLGRLGGEEFLALLPGADLAAALAAGERLRKAVAAAPVQAGAAGIAVTVSVGCAALGRDEDGAALLARADARLYEAKRAGRDRVAG